MANKKVKCIKDIGLYGGQWLSPISPHFYQFLTNQNQQLNLIQTNNVESGKRNVLNDLADAYSNQNGNATTNGYARLFSILTDNGITLNVDYNITNQKTLVIKDNYINKNGVAIADSLTKFSVYCWFTSLENFGVVIPLFTSSETPLNSNNGFCVLVWDKATYGTPISFEVTPDSSSGGGLNGDYDNSSDHIGLPDTPALGITNTGFINLYKITNASLAGLGAELFPDFEQLTPYEPSTPDTIENGLLEVCNTLVNLVGNIPNLAEMYINNGLINYVLDCHIIPVNPLSGSAEKIKIGFKDFKSEGERISTDYYDFDCGTLNIKEYFGSFLDFSPYTDTQLYLPFVGFVPLEEEYYQNGSLRIVYRFNVVDGSFMCYLLSSSGQSSLEDSIVKQFSGNCCVHIPLTGSNYSSLYSNIVGTATQAISGKSVANVATSALDTISNKPSLQGSNNYNATSSFLGVRVPYLLISRPTPQYQSHYASENGYPCIITTELSGISGYTIIDKPFLENVVSATSQEKETIKDLLKTGVYF